MRAYLCSLQMGREIIFCGLRNCVLRNENVAWQTELFFRFSQGETATVRRLGICFFLPFFFVFGR